MVARATGLLTARMWPALLANHGVLITYEREGTGVPLETVKGRRNIEQVNGEGIVTAVVDEWFFLTEALISAGLNEPARRDQILWEGHMGQQFVSEVHLAPGARHWTYIDPEGTIAQVFTVEVKS